MTKILFDERERTGMDNRFDTLVLSVETRGGGLERTRTTVLPEPSTVTNERRKGSFFSFFFKIKCTQEIFRLCIRNVCVFSDTLYGFRFFFYFVKKKKESHDRTTNDERCTVD